MNPRRQKVSSSKGFDPSLIEETEKELHALAKLHLSTHGLTEDSYSQIEEEIRKNEALKEKYSEWEMRILVVTFVLISLFFLIWDGDFDLKSLFGSLLASLFVTGILWITVGRGLGSLVDANLKAKIPEDIDKWNKYKTAYAEYEEKKQELRRRLEELRRRWKEIARMKERQYWTDQSGLEFERSIGDLFEDLGYEVERTQPTGDVGVDIFLDNRRIAVQCKATKASVSPGAVRDLFGAMNHFKCEKEILVSTGGFTKGCYEFSRGKRIELRDLDRVIKEARKLGIVNFEEEGKDDS